MEYIDLKVQDCHYRIEFERRITVITGDSGVGKTEFASNLVVSTPGIELSSSRPIIRANENWETLLRHESNSIFVFDDLAVVGSSHFSSVVSETEDTGNFIVIIGRENFSSKHIAQVSVSTSSMYEFCTSADGKEHYLIPMYPESEDLIRDSTTLSNIKFSHVVIEDSNSGKEWFTKLFTNKLVKSAFGKGNVSNTISKLVKGCKMEKTLITGILTIFDNAAFGGYMDRFLNTAIKVFKTSGIHVYYLDSYESFEELLLSTNLLMPDVNEDLTREELNKMYSWENSYEKILHKITNGKPYSIQDKSRLPNCYFEDCCSSGGCNRYMTGVKFEALLANTKYDFLLSLR